MSETPGPSCPAHRGGAPPSTDKRSRSGAAFAFPTRLLAGDWLAEYDGRPVLYGAHELDQVVLAYATTVHKAQGCEYPAVVIPVTTQHYPMLQRNLIYTGITRGRKLVVLVGQKKALAMAVRGSRAVRRWSKQGEWLAAGLLARQAV